MSCTAAHLRSQSLNIMLLSDMIQGSYRSWDLYTTGQLVDGLQQKRKPVFIKRKWNHVVFSRATILSFHPVSCLSSQVHFSNALTSIYFSWSLTTVVKSTLSHVMKQNKSLMFCCVLYKSRDQNYHNYLCIVHTLILHASWNLDHEILEKKYSCIIRTI